MIRAFWLALVAAVLLVACGQESEPRGARTIVASDRPAGSNLYRTRPAFTRVLEALRPFEAP